MVNREIAKAFYAIATYLYMDNVPFKPFAYEKVAQVLEALDQDVEEIYKKDGFEGLKGIAGVGEGLAKAIEEYLKTGTVRILDEYKKKIPVKLDELMGVEGLGPKRIKTLYEKLNIKNLKQLGQAAKKGKIKELFGFGEKVEKNILEGIDFLSRNKGRVLIGEIMPVVKDILKRLGDLKEVKKISLAGSIRRMKETVGDVDILVVAKNHGKVVDFFTKLPGVEKVWAKGSTKASVHLKWGIDADLRIVPEKSYGSALQYFTGSKEHNIETRMIAISKGLKLNEYGVFSGSKMVAGKTEEGIYSALGLPWIAPELRENQGELTNKLPKLIEREDIKGDLHCHSSWDGGRHSIEVMAKKAMDLGYKYIGISDHTEFLHIERGLTGGQLLKQKKEIEKLNLKYKDFKILHGCEANVMADGSIDIKDEILSQLDYVIAGVHSQLKMGKDQMTERIIKAMRNPNVDIISHPTGRLIQQRDEYQIDINRIFGVAKETETILEINSSPYRLDLKDTNIKKAKEAGVKMIINTDAHEKEQMDQMEYGVSQARRGWAEKGDVINTQPLDKVLKYFK